MKSDLQYQSGNAIIKDVILAYNVIFVLLLMFFHYKKNLGKVTQLSYIFSLYFTIIITIVVNFKNQITQSGQLWWKNWKNWVYKWSHCCIDLSSVQTFLLLLDWYNIIIFYKIILYICTQQIIVVSLWDHQLNKDHWQFCLPFSKTKLIIVLSCYRQTGWFV